jgi:hypothetical protein
MELLKELAAQARVYATKNGVRLVKGAELAKLDRV